MLGDVTISRHYFEILLTITSSCTYWAVPTTTTTTTDERNRPTQAHREENRLTRRCHSVWPFEILSRYHHALLLAHTAQRRRRRRQQGRDGGERTRHEDSQTRITCCASGSLLATAISRLDGRWFWRAAPAQTLAIASHSSSHRLRPSPSLADPVEGDGGGGGRGEDGGGDHWRGGGLSLIHI